MLREIDEAAIAPAMLLMPMAMDSPRARKLPMGGRLGWNSIGETTTGTIAQRTVGSSRTKKTVRIRVIHARKYLHEY